MYVCHLFLFSRPSSCIYTAQQRYPICSSYLLLAYWGVFFSPQSSCTNLIERVSKRSMFSSQVKTLLSKLQTYTFVKVFSIE